jgi:dTDP-4-dehydrorhamnose 3,5-epimerase
MSPKNGVGGMAFQRTTTGLAGLIVLEPQVFGDDRGYFKETYREADFKELGLPGFVQENESRSKAGVLRGLHYQLKPASLTKLVRCVRGAIFDVAVDIRKSSPTYGGWHGIELTEENHKMFLVPEGFAHGFLTLREDTVIVYKQTDYYNAQLERSVLWSDPALNIQWPMTNPLLSSKDEQAKALTEVENNFD